MSNIERMHLDYIADPVPIEHRHVGRLVVPDVGFGVAMRIYFDAIDLVPIMDSHTFFLIATNRLLAGLPSTIEELPPMLHARLSSLVADAVHAETMPSSRRESEVAAGDVVDVDELKRVDRGTPSAIASVQQPSPV